MKQKFLRGHRVRIAEHMPLSMHHFTCNCDAVIVGSYRDLHGDSSNDTTQYAIVLDIPEDMSLEVESYFDDGPYTRTVKKGQRSSAWYPEELLTLVDSDRDVGEEFLQEYNQRG